MASINFRDKDTLFDSIVCLHIDNIHQYLHVGTKTEELKYLFDRFYSSLAYFYRKEKNYKEKEAHMLADKVFSEFCQNSIYYIYHNTYPSNNKENKTPSNKKYNTVLNSKAFLTFIIQHPKFFYVNAEGSIRIWIDPQEQETCLNVASRSDDDGKIVSEIMSTAIKFLKSTKNKDFKKLISISNKDNYSPLMSGCFAGNDQIVKLLLDAAEKMFGGKNTNGFQDFITHINKNKFSAFNTACRAGNLKVLEILFFTAAEAFGGIKTEQFQLYIQHENNNGFSPLNTACADGHFEIVKFLLEQAELVFDKEKFEIFITKLNQDKYSPLHSACVAGHYDIVKLLLEKAAHFFGGKHNEKFQRFLSSENKNNYSLLMDTCCKGHLKITELILSEGAEAFGGRNTREFKERLLEYKNKQGFTPLNSSVLNKQSEIAKLLIEYGADPNIKNNVNTGFSAIDNVKNNKSMSFVMNAAIQMKLDALQKATSEKNTAMEQKGEVPTNFKNCENLLPMNDELLLDKSGKEEKQYPEKLSGEKRKITDAKDSYFQPEKKSKTEQSVEARSSKFKNGK